MISKITAVRLFMAIVGIVSIIVIFLVGSRFKWDDSTQIIMALLIGTATTLIEMVISFDALKDSIETIYPALELSLEEQRSINKSIILCNELRKKDNPSAKIALAGFEKVSAILAQAIDNNDYTYNDIFEANMIALSTLKPRQSFKGISALIKPQFWKNGKVMSDYRNVNYSQAAKGVIIERVFLFNKKDEIDAMHDVMLDQYKNGISVFYAIKDDISKFLHYPDFSVMEEIGFGLVVHREDMLERVTVTTNQNLVGELSDQFDTLKSMATTFIE